MHVSRHRALIAALLILCCTACGQREPVAEVSEDLRVKLPAIAAAMGRAQALTVDLIMAAKQPDQDRTIFTISACITRDDSLRVHISKLGYPYLSARIDADGSLIAHQMLDKYAIESDLETLEAAGRAIDEERRAERGDETAAAAASIDLFQELRLMMGEFTHGPIPEAERYDFSQLHQGAFACDLTDGNRAHFRLTPDRRGVSEKWIHTADGRPLLSISYRRYEEDDGLYRATRMAFDVAEHEGEYKIRVKRFDNVPAIAPDRMQIDIPTSSENLEPKQFILRMIDDDDDKQDDA